MRGSVRHGGHRRRMARSPLSFVRRGFAEFLLRRGGASVSVRDEGDRERSGCEAAKERRGATSHRLPSAMVADALSVVLEPRAGEGRCERKSANEALREARARYDGARYARFHTSEWYLCTRIPVVKELAEGGSYRLVPTYDENGRFFHLRHLHQKQDMEGGRTYRPLLHLRKQQ